MTAADRVLDALSAGGYGPRKSGRSWTARCPAHEDRKPSLNVTPIEGQVLVHCHANCPIDDVVGALDLTMTDLFDNRSGVSYAYTDAAGRPTRTVHRKPGHTFAQSGDTKGRPSLYRLPQVLEAVRTGQPVYIVEGEKDVHAAETLGVVATTSPMGAGNFPKVDTAPLIGADLVVVPDQDQPGARYLADVLATVNGSAASVKVMRPAVGKDLADHVAAGYGLSELLPADTVNPVTTGRTLVLVRADTIKPRPVRWLWSRRVPLSTLTLLAGREGLGKSTLTVDLAAKVTLGTLEGDLFGVPRDVVYIASEDSRDQTIVPRLIAAGADRSRISFVDVQTEYTDTGSIVLPTDSEQLEQLVAQTAAALIVLDAATSVIDPDLDGNSDRRMRIALEMIARVSERTGAGTVGIVHFGKRDSTDTGKLILGTLAWSQVARSVLAVARDDDTGDCVLSLVKANLATLDVASQGFRLVEEIVHTDDGPAPVGRIKWLGDADRSVRELLGGPSARDDETDRTEVERWLKNLLKENAGTITANSGRKAAARDGFSVDQVKRARRRLGVLAEKSSMAGGWVWVLPGVALDEEGAKEAKEAAHNDPPSTPSSPPSSDAESPEPLWTENPA